MVDVAWNLPVFDLESQYQHLMLHNQAPFKAFGPARWCYYTAGRLKTRENVPTFHRTIRQIPENESGSRSEWPSVLQAIPRKAPGWGPETRGRMGEEAPLSKYGPFLRLGLQHLVFHGVIPEDFTRQFCEKSKVNGLESPLCRG